MAHFIHLAKVHKHDVGVLVAQRLQCLVAHGFIMGHVLFGMGFQGELDVQKLLPIHPGAIGDHVMNGFPVSKGGAPGGGLHILDVAHEMPVGLKACTEETVVFDAVLVHPHTGQQAGPAWTADRGLVGDLSQFAACVNLPAVQTLRIGGQGLEMRREAFLHDRSNGIRAAAIHANEQDPAAFKVTALSWPMGQELRA